LHTYEGEDTPEGELALMTQVLETNRQRKDELNRLKVEEAKYQTEIKMLEERIESSLVNEQKNAKRNKYLGTLNSLYELFHVSQFPRRLIQSYAGDVQELLIQHTQKFNIPYTPEIAEGFKILMRDEHGRVVPTVSGGQKVIVGLSLRLALHSLFAQSFPMWIVDEGTTHLDTENVKLYFEVIRQLRKESTIKQVIIIDHNEQLAEVVDNVIKV
jgi:DNA repair protein SbcC/Rad50